MNEWILIVVFDIRLHFQWLNTMNFFNKKNYEKSPWWGIFTIINVLSAVDSHDLMSLQMVSLENAVD